MSRTKLTTEFQRPIASCSDLVRGPQAPQRHCTLKRQRPASWGQVEHTGQTSMAIGVMLSP
jgi:hypothetical protein